MSDQQRTVAVAAIKLHSRYGVDFTRRLAAALDRLVYLETGEGSAGRTVTLGTEVEEKPAPAKKKPEADDSDRALAEFFADTFNLLSEAGSEPTEDDLHAAHAELSQTDWHVGYDERKGVWAAFPAKDEEGEYTLAAERAPKGGISIGGRAFKGGMFIPSKVMAQATPEEKAKIAAAKQGHVEKRQSRGSVDAAALHERLAKHAKAQGPLNADETKSAKLMAAAFHSHHGELALHRIEEIADRVERTLQGITDDHPNSEGLRGQLGRKLAQLHDAAGRLQGKHGITGEVKKAEPVADAQEQKRQEIIAAGHITAPGKWAAGTSAKEMAKGFGLPEDFYDDQRRMERGTGGFPIMHGEVHISPKYDPDGKVQSAVEARLRASKQGTLTGANRRHHDEQVQKALAAAVAKAKGGSSPVAGEAKGGSSAPDDAAGRLGAKGVTGEVAKPEPKEKPPKPEPKPKKEKPATAAPDAALHDAASAIGEPTSTDRGKGISVSGYSLVREMKKRGMSKEQVEKTLEGLADADRLQIQRHDQPGQHSDLEKDIPRVFGTPVASVVLYGGKPEVEPPAPAPESKEPAKPGKPAPAPAAPAKETPAATPSPAPKPSGEKPAAAPAAKGTPKPAPAKRPEAKPAKKDAAGKPADPMAGHPMAGKTPQEMRAKMAGYNHTARDNNPEGYDLKNFPPGVNGPAVANHVLGDVEAANKKSAFNRPDLKTLYESAAREFPGLTVQQFHGVLAKMHGDRKVRLDPYTQSASTVPAERLPHMMPLDKENKHYVDTPASGKIERYPGGEAKPASPAKDHAAAVTDAFDKIAKAHGGLVPLHKLQQETGLSRDDLHAAVQDLRRRGVLTGMRHEGRGSIDPALAAAAIPGGGPYDPETHYVSRRQGG